jgi:hypothetical protein
VGGLVVHGPLVNFHHLTRRVSNYKVEHRKETRHFACNKVKVFFFPDPEAQWLGHLHSESSLVVLPARLLLDTTSVQTTRQYCCFTFSTSALS